VTGFDDGGWLTAALGVGILIGAGLALLVARRRGHVRMSIEVGDPPTPPDDGSTPGV
jgi:LPXTG-motif cell wall-anchored protein